MLQEALDKMMATYAKTGDLAAVKQSFEKMGEQGWVSGFRGLGC